VIFKKFQRRLLRALPAGDLEKAVDIPADKAGKREFFLLSPLQSTRLFEFDLAVFGPRKGGSAEGERLIFLMTVLPFLRRTIAV
jgi:hypothetical protein